MKSIAERQAQTSGEQPAPKAAPQGQTSGNEAGNEAERGPLDEKDQAAYSKVAMAAAEIIYNNEESHQQIMSQLQAGAETPDQTVASMAVTILTQIDEKSNGTIPEDIILLPFVEIVEQLIEVGTAAQLFAGDQAMMDRATQMGLEQLAPIYGLSEADIAYVMDGVSDTERDQMVAQQQASAGMGQEQGAQPAPPPGIIEGNQAAV